MLITDKNQLKQYYTDKRIWQGIPSIEVTKKGRIFSTFYSGGSDEEKGNFVLLLKSDDGENFGEPITISYIENGRCCDPCLWIDPLGRLWLYWNEMPENAVYGCICENPDAEEIVFGDIFRIADGLMLNKPIVLSTGEWLFPVSVWGERVWSWMPERRPKGQELGAFAYQSCDNGKTFQKLGKVIHPDHAYDEHMFLELNDKRIMMLCRTMSGIGVSYSYNRGKTWSEPADSGIKGPCSRFHISRLKSGRVLLINHYDYKYRDNLYALISDDDCKTWQYKLLLDERGEVSYPDAVEADDGFIYITYDRERGAGSRSLDAAYSKAREVLYAKITEQDIISGKLENPDSKLKCIISKLGEYNGAEYDFIDRPRLYEYDSYFGDCSTEEMLKRLFRMEFGSHEPDLSESDHELFESLMTDLDKTENRKEVIHKIIVLIKNAKRRPPVPVDEMVCKIVTDNISKEHTVESLAKELKLSKTYLGKRFFDVTGITVEEYVDVLKKLNR